MDWQAIYILGYLVNFFEWFLLACILWHSFRFLHQALIQFFFGFICVKCIQNNAVSIAICDIASTVL